DGIVLYDRDGNCEFANRAIQAMLGYKRGEITSTNINSIIHPGDLSDDPVAYAELDKGEITRKERRLKCKDGTLTPVEVTSKRVPKNSYLTIVRDIAGRKRSEKGRLAIYKLASALVRTNSLDQIFQESFDALEDAIGVERASISLLSE